MMKASPSCIQLIKQCESLSLKAYLCPAKVWTIGWGHTLKVQPGQQITEAEAEQLLAEDIAAVEKDLPKVIHVPLSQGQWDALVSLSFNLRGGAMGLPHLAPHLLSNINNGEFSKAAQEFLDINKANGVVLAGLTRRRVAERQMFLAA